MGSILSICVHFKFRIQKLFWSDPDFFRSPVRRPIFRTLPHTIAQYRIHVAYFRSRWIAPPLTRCFSGGIPSEGNPSHQTLIHGVSPNAPPSPPFIWPQDRCMGSSAIPTGGNPPTGAEGGGGGLGVCCLSRATSPNLIINVHHGPLILGPLSGNSRKFSVLC